MLKLLVACVLVASTAGVPRSRGEPVHRSIPAQSGVPIQYNTNPQQQQPAVHMVPVALSSPQSQATATFQVNPDTLEIRPVAQPGIPQNPLNPAARPISHNFQNQIVPQANPARPPLQNFQNQPVPLALPTQHNFQNRPVSAPVRQSLQFRDATETLNTPQTEIVKRLIGNPPGGALLVGTNPPLFPIEKRLISNYTKLRPVVTDTFRCDRASQPKYVGYGYYGDVENDCQVFHICLPWKELYPETFDTDVTYQFSFICPNQTVFSQDVLTCTWESEALPCELSPELYWMNSNFFRMVPGDDEFGERYAQLNEPL